MLGISQEKTSKGEEKYKLRSFFSLWETHGRQDRGFITGKKEYCRVILCVTDTWNVLVTFISPLKYWGHRKLSTFIIQYSVILATKCNWGTVRLFFSKFMWAFFIFYILLWNKLKYILHIFYISVCIYMFILNWNKNWE